MLTRTHRFHGYGSLRRTYQNGQTVRDSLLNLRYVSRGTDRPYRVAVVVSRKVSKSAVVRNRIRRRIYEQVRQSVVLPPSTDLIFTVYNASVAEVESVKLTASVNELLQKAALQLKKPA